MKLNSNQVIDCLASGVAVHQIFCLSETEITTPSGILSLGQSIQIQKSPGGLVSNYVVLNGDQIVQGQKVDLFSANFPDSAPLEDSYFNVAYITDYDEDLS